MKFYVGITDSDWYNQLKALKPEEVNFWQPGGNTVFRVLPEEGLFLFKLHHPRNFIVGGGYFVRHSFCLSHWPGRLSEQRMVWSL